MGPRVAFPLSKDPCLQAALKILEDGFHLVHITVWFVQYLVTSGYSKPSN